MKASDRKKAADGVLQIFDTLLTAQGGADLPDALLALSAAGRDAKGRFVLSVAELVDVAAALAAYGSEDFPARYVRELAHISHGAPRGGLRMFYEGWGVRTNSDRLESWDVVPSIAEALGPLWELRDENNRKIEACELALACLAAAVRLEIQLWSRT